MQPIARGAVFVAVLAAVSTLASERTRAPSDPPSAAPGPSDLLLMPCGPRAIPEGATCVPLPSGSGAEPPGEVADGDDLAPARIPRRPDRPSDAALLALPIPGATIAQDDSRGAFDVLRLVGEPGAEVRWVALHGQQADAQLLAVVTRASGGFDAVVLASTVSGRAESRWVVVIGPIATLGDGVAGGLSLSDGHVLGVVDGALSFSARKLRAGVDSSHATVDYLLGDDASIAVDVRNVLPVVAAPSPQ